MMNFCPRKLRKLFGGYDKANLPFLSTPTSSSSEKNLDILSAYRNLSASTTSSYFNLIAFVILANITNVYYTSLFKIIMITFGCLIHFSPVLLHESLTSPDSLKNIAHIILALNLGVLTSSWEEHIFLTVIFLGSLVLLRSFDQCFYSLQLATSLLLWSLLLMGQGAAGTNEFHTFIVQHPYFIVSLAGFMAFLSISFMSPPDFLVNRAHNKDDV